jgi:hypothetical protein
VGVSAPRIGFSRISARKGAALHREFQKILEIRPDFQAIACGDTFHD